MTAPPVPPPVTPPRPPTLRWPSPAASAAGLPGMAIALRRGCLGQCPNCGGARLFAGWLRQVDVCPRCAAPLGLIRADDAPPYIVVFITGHLVIAALLLLDGMMTLTVRTEILIFLPLTLLLALGLLRPVKGATIGAMLQLRMIPVADA